MSELIHIMHINHTMEEIDWTKLRSDVRHGLYIVQSTRRRELFRIGAGGVGASATSTLGERVKAHTTGEPSDINPTMQFKRWRVIWVALFPSCDKQTTLLAEISLMSTFAMLYVFVHESIFYAEDGDGAVETAIQTANKCKASLSRLIKFQTAGRYNLPSDLKDISTKKCLKPGFLT